jgi:hypothetical protein
MAMGGRAYRCVGGPYDGVTLCTLRDDQCIRLEAPQQVPSSLTRGTEPDTTAETQTTEYQVRRLMAPDGKWHEFLVSSSLTTMQATVWLNRRQ